MLMMRDMEASLIFIMNFVMGFLSYRLTAIPAFSHVIYCLKPSPPAGKALQLTERLTRRFIEPWC